MAATIANPSPMHRIAKAGGESGQFFKDYHMARRLPAFRDFVTQSPIGEIVATLMKSSKANFFYDVLWIKEPGTSKASAPSPGSSTRTAAAPSATRRR